MQARAVERDGIIERLFQRRAESIFPSRNCRETALPRFPVTGRQIEERLLKTGVLQACVDRFGREIIRKQELDTLEPGIGRSLETVKERMLLKHHG